MKALVRFSAALWIGLAWAGSAGLSLAAPVTDPVRAQAGVITATPLSSGAEQPSKPDFSGHWIFNAKASDDPQEKLKEAMQALQQTQRSGGRGMGGGSGRQGRGGGKGGGQQGRGSADGMGGRSAMPVGELSELMATPTRLDITHEDPLLIIADENDRRQRLFTDFRGASVSISGGAQQRVAVAGWEGDVLVVETTIRGGPRLIQRYQIDAETGQLTISDAANLAERQPLTFRLVYDRVKPGEDAGSRQAGDTATGQGS